MSGRPFVSIVVPNYGREKELARLVRALAFQRYRHFEIIIVTNLPPGRRPASDLPIRYIALDEPNISQARNLGIAAARGEIIAFCDDDSVPEFGWLTHLVTGFDSDRVASAGGYVRGRNGVSFQWKTHLFDRYGNDRAVDVPGTDPHLFAPFASGTLKTVGTNSAFRRSALLEIGGFDEAFRYYLDETDVNMRLAKAGWMSAIVPLAEVHHDFAESQYRNRARVPHTLEEIGASRAYFLRKHAGSEDQAPLLDHIRQHHHRRLRKLFMLGLMEGRDVAPMMQTLEAGFAKGASRVAIAPDLSAPRSVDLPVTQTPERPRTLLTSLPLARFRNRRRAAEAARAGHEVTVLEIDYSPRPLTVEFRSEGFWLHRLGLFGRDERHKRWRPARINARISRELTRIATQRGRLA